ncbi:MAG: hypothetical protein V7K77_03500 [Nostoc sp.]|uniref:hypothetical protein n=1 Tax=Nostoc sp. TaxID=1180 RepID=UPI002FF43EC6
MNLFGFGGKKGQKAKNSKKSKPREVWKGKSFPLDDIITPSVFVGGGENSPEPFLIDLHTVPGLEIDPSQTDLLHELNTKTLELLTQPHTSLLDHQIMSDVLLDPSYQPLPFFDNLSVSTNSFTENTSLLHSSDACPAQSAAIYNGESASGKELPGITTFPGATAPFVPQTNVDTGGNDLANPTSIIRSAIQDVIDQVSGIDPIDIYRVNINDLKNADISVLSGEISVNYLMPSGQFLGSQIFSKGNYTLQPPAGITGDVIVKINYQGGTPGTYILNGFESKAAEPFNIDLEFEGGLSTSQQAIIRAAAKSVEAIITQGLPTAIVDGKIIDDVNFKISATNLDGAGGTAAQTKIDFMRFGTMLPAQSITQFDAADIAELESSGELFSVVQHELLHGLGFGNLWEAKGLVDYAGTPLAQYNGKEAVKAFNELGGLTDNIALENEGNGSAGLHWNESLFQDEVMTADYNDAKGGNAPISAVTIASLADLGYQVNLNRATPDFGLFGGQKFKPEDLTPEQIEAFRELAETSFGNPDEEFIYATMPEVDPDTVAPEIWAHAERFWKNGQYYDWQRYQIKSGDTLSGIAQRTLGNVGYDYYMWIANHNGIPNANYIVTGNWIDIPVYHPNYEWEMEQERLRREAELRQRQEEEARIRREQEEAFAREQERVRQEAEARQREAEAQQKQLEEQERRLREEMERRRQEEERLKEEARLRELERQAEITRQQGKGGLDWFIAKSLPEFGPVDPFESRLTGETVGNLVPDDYYRFTLSRNGRITAELKQLLADADLVLYDVRNHPISYSMRDGITDEQLIADLIPGTYMLRVNSPKGVTTDYELIVKFQHLLSATQKGPPPGWRVGGGNGGNSGSSSSSGGGSAGQIFADPRIKRIYDTALNNFVIPERAKANAQIQQLGREKQSYEQELQQLLDQMNGEQRAKVHRALDSIRDERRAWVDSVANPIKNGIDSTADWIIDQMESKIPGQVYNIPGIGDQLRSAKDSLKSGINGARSWLKGKVDEVQNAVKDAIWQFTEALKNAYRTGAEINGAIETAAQQLKQTIDNLVGNINNWVNEFKGKVLDSVQWLRNVGVNIPDIKDFWGHTLISGFKWNFYDSVVEPLANSLANGIKNSVSSVGDFAKGTVDWIKPRAQSAVAAVVDAIFGDKTGTLYNKIHGVDQQIEATKTGLERAITNAGTRILGVVRQIEAFLTDPEERKRVLDALFQRGYQTAEEAYKFATEELPKVRDQIAQEAKAAFEKAKKAFADLVRSILKSQLPNKGSINLKSDLKVGIDAAVEGAYIKPGVEYQLSRDGDSYTVSSKGILGFGVEGGLGTPVGGGVSVAGIADQKINLKFDPKLKGSITPAVGLLIQHGFVDAGEEADDEMIKLGGWIFKELKTPADVITDPILSGVLTSNLKSIEVIKGFEASGKLELGNLEGEVKGGFNRSVGVVRGDDGLPNSQFKIEGYMEGEISLGIGAGAGLKSSIIIESRDNQVKKLGLEIEGSISGILNSGVIPMFASNPGAITDLIEDAKLTTKLTGKGIGALRMKIEVKDFEKLAQSSTSLYQALVDLTQIENGAELTADIKNTINSGVDFLSALNSSTSISIEADTQQLVSLEVSGKVVAGGELKTELGRVETKTIYSNK